MTLHWPRAWGDPPASGLIRCVPEDFRVSEQLGFDLSGSGEHVFLHLQKRQLNSMELLERIARLSSVAPKNIGLSGLKDRNAVTRQWFSVGMAGRAEPDWRLLEADGDVQLLAHGRHARKLRRGVHRANCFNLVVRDVQGDRRAIEQRLQLLRERGVPNYFGEQRFGRDGSTLEQARRWAASGGRRITHTKRGLYLSALRAFLFNTLLAARVDSGRWNQVLDGDVCLLHGTRSLFHCETVDDDIRTRVLRADLHPGLPLWGRGLGIAPGEVGDALQHLLGEHRGICEFLEQAGLEPAWRPTRLVADDFCWQFCDDGSLQLEFALGAGAYATALLAEFVLLRQGGAPAGASASMTERVK
jgi:tRNA pseudouridine13 synthase